MITYDDFKKVEISAGKILSAEKIPDTDKLLKLSVDFGMKTLPAQTPVVSGAPVSHEIVTAPVAVPVIEQVADIRQIVSGISAYFPDPSVLVGKTCMFVTNLEPRTIKGYESNGMIFALSTDAGSFSLLEPNGSIPPGTKAK
jgi:methionyl-tRNA synthetase